MSRFAFISLPLICYGLALFTTCAPGSHGDMAPVKEELGAILHVEGMLQNWQEQTQKKYVRLAAMAQELSSSQMLGHESQRPTLSHDYGECMRMVASLASMGQPIEMDFTSHLACVRSDLDRIIIGKRLYAISTARAKLGGHYNRLQLRQNLERYLTGGVEESYLEDTINAAVRKLGLLAAMAARDIFSDEDRQQMNYEYSMIADELGDWQDNFIFNHQAVNALLRSVSGHKLGSISTRKNAQEIVRVIELSN